MHADDAIVLPKYCY